MKERFCEKCGEAYTPYIHNQTLCMVCKNSPNVCSVCGKLFMPYGNGKKARASKFCSRSCSLRGSVPQRDIVCKRCGKTFVHVGRGWRKFCVECRKIVSLEISLDWQTKYKTMKPGVGSGGAQWQEDNHQYIDGSSQYLARYRTRCLKVKDAVCIICGSIKNVHVHHKDGDSRNYAVDNLEPLCASCHKKLHWCCKLHSVSEEVALDRLSQDVCRSKIAEKSGNPNGDSPRESEVKVEETSHND